MLRIVIIPVFTACALALSPAAPWAQTSPQASGAATAAQDQRPRATADPDDVEDAVERIEESIEVLRKLTSTPENQIPAYLLERAEAIIVIPSLVKGGFVVGAKHGKGVVSTRDRESNTWSAPAFVQLTGGSIGWQIGLQSVDLVLLVMNRDGVEELLENRFTLGATAAVAAGPVGRQAEAATDAELSSQILAYSQAKGVFAGATLEGAALRADDDANEDLYGVENIELDDVLVGMAQATPTIVATWKNTLRQITRSQHE